MSSFPVVMLEQNWKHRFPTQNLQPERRRLTTSLIVSPATITPLPTFRKTDKIPKILLRKDDKKPNKPIVGQNLGEAPKSTLNKTLHQVNLTDRSYSLLLPRETRKQNIVVKIDNIVKKHADTSDTDTTKSDKAVASSDTCEIKLKQNGDLKREIPIITESERLKDVSGHKKQRISLLQSSYKKERLKENITPLNINKTIFSHQKVKPSEQTETRSEYTKKESGDSQLKPSEFKYLPKEKTEEVIVEITDINSDEGLSNLLSVAEAFERSQKPDFNDVLNPIVSGTDTEKVLLRNCVICKKQLLGRNAYGRHMKNVHSKIFGPYPCPADECDKQFESGYLLMQHMYIHLGPRGKASGRFS